MSPSLDSAPTEFSARMGTDTTMTSGNFRGTDGSTILFPPALSQTEIAARLVYRLLRCAAEAP
jgi:hypothetical protein